MDFLLQQSLCKRRSQPGGWAIASTTLATLTALVALVTTEASALAQSGLSGLEDPDYWTRVCQLQVSIPDYESALSACSQALTLSPKDPLLWTTHGEILLQLQQYPEAIASAERAIAFDSQNLQALTQQCLAYTALGQATIALDLCDQAVAREDAMQAETTEEISQTETTPTETTPTDAPSQTPAPITMSLLNRARVFEQLDDTEQALREYEQLQLLNPADPQTLAYKCRTQIDLQRYQPALYSCQQAIENSEPNDTDTLEFALFHKGIAHARSDQSRKAVEAFDLALALNPNNAETWLAQAQVLQTREQFTAALTSFTRTVELTPSSSQALLGQCSVLNRLQDYEAAAAACQQAIQADGQWLNLGEAEAWNQWGQSLFGLGDPEAALAAIDRAVGMRPGYIAAWSDRSVVHWHMGTDQQQKLDVRAAIASYAQAVDSAERALELIASSAESPHPPSIRLQAKAYANMGRYQRSLAQIFTENASPQSATDHFSGALSAYTQALALNPADPETWVNQSVVLWFTGRYAEALSAARQAIALDPNLVEAWQAQAVAQVALNDHFGARQSYQAAIDRDAENADAWAGLGVVSLVLSDRQAGIEALQIALQLNPNQSVALRTVKLLEEDQ